MYADSYKQPPGPLYDVSWCDDVYITGGEYAGMYGYIWYNPKLSAARTGVREWIYTVFVYLTGDVAEIPECHLAENLEEFDGADLIYPAAQSIGYWYARQAPRVRMWFDGNEL